MVQLVSGQITATMERQPSLPQPVLYEADAFPLVSVAEGTPSPGHEVLVVPVWEASDSKPDKCLQLLLTEQAHLALLSQASQGALESALKLHAFSGKKVQPDWILAAESYDNQSYG
jgi:hypothetical protein